MLSKENVAKVTLMDPNDASEGLASVDPAQPGELEQVRKEWRGMLKGKELDDKEAEEIRKPNWLPLSADINWHAPDVHAQHGFGLHSDVFSYAFIVSDPSLWHWAV